MEQYTATQIKQGVWTFEWVGAALASYEVWLDGVLLTTTEVGASSYTAPISSYTNTPPPVEIHSTLSPNKAQSREYPPRSVLQWRGVEGATGYLVERLSGGTWRPVANPSERMTGWYVFNTGALIDGAANQFTIKALDSRGIAGDALTFNVALVCNPIPPTVTISMVGGNVEVVSE